MLVTGGDVTFGAGSDVALGTGSDLAAVFRCAGLEEAGDAVTGWSGVVATGWSGDGESEGSQGSKDE